MHATITDNDQPAAESSTTELLESPSILDEAHDHLLEQLREHLDGLLDVTLTEVEASACGALGCRRSEVRLWRVSVEGRRTRTLCPTHSVDFIQKESRYDV